MGKKELLQNLYQIQEFMESKIFNIIIEEGDDIDENINEDMQEALDEAVECIEFTFNHYKQLKGKNKWIILQATSY